MVRFRSQFALTAVSAPLRAGGGYRRFAPISPRPTRLPPAHTSRRTSRTGSRHHAVDDQRKPRQSPPGPAQRRSTPRSDGCAGRVTTTVTRGEATVRRSSRAAVAERTPGPPCTPNRPGARWRPMSTSRCSHEHRRSRQRPRTATTAVSTRRQPISRSWLPLCLPGSIPDRSALCDTPTAPQVPTQRAEQQARETGDYGNRSASTTGFHRVPAQDAEFPIQDAEFPVQATEFPVQATVVSRSDRAATSNVGPNDRTTSGCHRNNTDAISTHEPAVTSRPGRRFRWQRASRACGSQVTKWCSAASCSLNVDPQERTVAVGHHLIRVKGQGLVRIANHKGNQPGLLLRVPEWSVPMLRRRKLASAGGPLYSSGTVSGWTQATSYSAFRKPLPKSAMGGSRHTSSARRSPRCWTKPAFH